MPSKKRTRQSDSDNTFDLSNYDIKTLDDLIELAMDFCKSRKKKPKTTHNLDKLPLIIEDLIELRDMIGLDKLKSQLLYQILYYLEDNDKMLMHTVIEGPPGSGKTTVATIMGRIYSKIGILKKRKFKVLGRADLIGEYLGETTQKTLDALESCKHGVAFIDEAYSLGSEDRTDIYSKEAIDTINQYLLENQDTFICIIAGYKHELDRCFFSKNPGLKRRFPWVFTIDPYSTENLIDILYLKLENSVDNWKLEEDVSKEYLIERFKLYQHIMVNNGGDIDIVLQFAKIINVRRHFGKDKTRLLSKGDINYALDELQETRKMNIPFLHPPIGMYS